jgi:hypothetical protein
MDLHVLHDDVALEVNDERPGPPGDLTSLLRDLSFVRVTSATLPRSRLVLSIRCRTCDAPEARPGRDTPEAADPLQVTQQDDDLCVSDGASWLRVQPRRGRATAAVAPSFDERPIHLRQRFWAYGIIGFLRQQGLYGLHAAGVATPRGDNLLVVGPSGCGKTTVTIGLIRAGGRFLSDDAVLLRAAPDGIDALSLRKPFSVDTVRAGDYPDLVPDVAQARGPNIWKCRADALREYSVQSLERFRPRVIVFPRIVPQTTSALSQVSRSAALRHLLEQSGPELFDRATMAEHAAVLSRLLRQSTSYELLAGRDLRESAQSLVDLLADTPGVSAWPDSSSN